MDYLDLYHQLKSTVNYDADRIEVDRGARVYNLAFRSGSARILTGETTYVCPLHGTTFREEEAYANEIGLVTEVLDLHDSRVEENREFRYHIFRPAEEGRSRRVILLFHGFNEKHWHKYLPWAHRLVQRTGKTVILFPIAFHMNRAPVEWSDRRLMHRVCELRRRSFPSVIGSCFSNVATSTRLQARPQRFFWSGLQTFADVMQLVGGIRSGSHPHVDPAASIDIFAYSVGCLLAQILLMADPGGVFRDSRLCMFCGGAVLNRMTPVSRYILDSETNVALYSYAVEHLESHLKQDGRLRHYLSEAHPEGVNFRSMLNYSVRRREREEHFRRLCRRMMAITLESDVVMPPYEVMNVLQGSARDIPTRVEVLDFPFPYKHEDPFPATGALRDAVDRAFGSVFDQVADFLSAGSG